MQCPKHCVSCAFSDEHVADMQDILLMVGPYGDWIKHDLEERTVLVCECDGVRLISAEKHELLSRVPDSLVDIFKIGSTAPGALLTATSCIDVASIHQRAATVLFLLGTAQRCLYV